MAACAIRAAACAGETAAGQVVPRAAEYLSSLQLDASTEFPCLLDPTDLGTGDGWLGSAWGAFTDDESIGSAFRPARSR